MAQTHLSRSGKSTHDGMFWTCGICWPDGSQTEAARKELLDSLTESQMLVIQLFLSAMAKAWQVLMGTLTERQKELLQVLGQDRTFKDTITDLQEVAKR